MGEFISAAKEIADVRSIGEFFSWYFSLSGGLQVVYGFAIIGVLITTYILIKAIFVDKDYYTG